MKIKFKNGSTIDTIDFQTDNNNKGNRSNFTTVPCYDTLQNKWVMIMLDMREPIDRFIPEWLFAEWIARKEF